VLIDGTSGNKDERGRGEENHQDRVPSADFRQHPRKKEKEPVPYETSPSIDPEGRRGWSSTPVTSISENGPKGGKESQSPLHLLIHEDRVNGRKEGKTKQQDPSRRRHPGAQRRERGTRKEEREKWAAPFLFIFLAREQALAGPEEAYGTEFPTLAS